MRNRGAVQHRRLRKGDHGGSWDTEIKPVRGYPSPKRKYFPVKNSPFVRGFPPGECSKDKFCDILIKYAATGTDRVFRRASGFWSIFKAVSRSQTAKPAVWVPVQTLCAAPVRKIPGPGRPPAGRSLDKAGLWKRTVRLNFSIPHSGSGKRLRRAEFAGPGKLCWKLYGGNCSDSTGKGGQKCQKRKVVIPTKVFPP